MIGWNEEENDIVDTVTESCEDKDGEQKWKWGGWDIIILNSIYFIPTLETLSF